MADEKNGANRNLWIGVSIVLLITVIVIIISLSVTNLIRAPEIVLSTWLIIGVIALLVALSFTAVIFNSLGLTNTTHALGLPEGSIRATIALSLILIFIMSSIFLYWQVDHSGEYISRSITVEQINVTGKGDIVRIVPNGTTSDNESLYDVTLLVEKNNTASTDIAKQIITTVSTLVVAIAGFYFGTQAVAVTKGNEKSSKDPVITKIEPTSLPQENEGTLTIYGENLNQVKDVRLTRGPATAIFEDLKATSTMVTVKIKTQGLDVGKWTVVVKNADGREDPLEDSFEVKPK